jgi:hypothetical protein|tara:strand:+ start:1420 stop:2136 length:717 start_codon:yes stop_codon:yes gene_type:complete
MNRTYLDSFISKYYLGGLISNTIWKVRDNTLHTSFTTEGKEMLGSVKFNNFTQPDADLGIVDTERLIRILSVLNGDCKLDYQKVEDRIIAMKLQDDNAEVKFNLGDLSIFGESAKLKNVPDFELVLQMTKQAAVAFVNGCNAITESNHFTVVGSDDSYELVVNYDRTKNLDMIRVPVKVISSGDIDGLSFASDHLRSIINANKDSDSISISVSSAGLLKCSFSSNSYNADYFLVAMDK